VSVFTRNHSCSACDSAYSYTFLRNVVCLSLCHIHAIYLNRSTDLDAIWENVGGGRKDTLAPVVSTLRGRAPPSPPPFRRLWFVRYSCGVKWHIVLDGGPWPQGRIDFVVKPSSQNVQLRCAVKPSVLCCHLGNTNEELGELATTIPLVLVNVTT